MLWSGAGAALGMPAGGSPPEWVAPAETHLLVEFLQEARAPVILNAEERTGMRRYAGGSATAVPSRALASAASITRSTSTPAAGGTGTGAPSRSERSTPA